MMYRERISAVDGDSRRATNGGYLLVEVLATMTISAFVLAALLSVVSFTVRASASVDRRTQNVEDVSRVIAALVRDIEQVAPVRWGGQGSGFVFQGSDTWLMFARETLAADGINDDQVVILQSKNGQLFHSEAQLLPTYRNATEIVAGPPQLMLDAQYTLRFAYFGRLENGTEALTDTWEDPVQLPVAVRLSMTDSNGRLVGSTRVQIRADAEPGCAVPTRTSCSFSTNADINDDAQPATAAAVDADDSLGWERYAQ